ncbi:MAG: NAD(P)-dependent oxidoreductase [Alphaproteobacteria bacterium]
MNIVVTKNLGLYPDQKKRIQELGNVLFHETESENPEEWYARCQDANIICTGLMGLNSDFVYELHDVFISIPFVGHEFLNLDKLKSQKVTVANAPGCNKEAVSEWIVSMLLFHFKNLETLTNSKTLTKNNALQRSLSIWDKKIAILGAGHIGQHLNKILTAFGAQTSFFKRGNDILEITHNADIVINCLAANEDTQGLLNKVFFQSLKKGVFFISVARPQVYDIEALIDCLNQGHIAAAIDDVANANVGDVNDVLYKRLASHPQILATPHISWNSESEARKANDIMINNIESWINGKPQNLLN